MSFKQKIQDVKGQERADLLPMFGKDIVEGAAVIGRYVGSGSYQVEDKDEAGNVTGKRDVRYVKLADVLEFRPEAAHATAGQTLQHLALGVPLNADTKNKLDPDTLPIGCYLIIEHTHRDERFGNMRRFRVEIITRAQYMELLNAEAAG